MQDIFYNQDLTFTNEESRLLGMIFSMQLHHHGKAGQNKFLRKLKACNASRSTLKKVVFA